MAVAFARIPPSHIDQLARSIILTPNERLAREMTTAYDQARLKRGDLAWPSFECRSLRSFWRQLHTTLTDAGVITWQLIPQHLINLSFQQAAPQEFSHQCRAAVDAWSLIRRYKIDLDHPLMAHNRAEYFRDWCTAADPTQQDAHAVEADLPQKLIAHIQAIAEHLEHPIVMVDIEHLSAAESDFFNALDQLPNSKVSLLQNQIWHEQFHPNLGLQNQNAPHQPTPMPRSLRGFSDLNQELMAAAQWCQEIYLENPEATIGVVIPDLSANYDRVLRQFSATLTPHRDSREPIFDISGGKSLVSQPVWRHARVLLNWLRQSADLTTLAPLLHSPFVSLPWCDELKQGWPKWAKRTLHPRAFAQYESAAPLLDVVRNLPAKARLDVWIDQINAALSAADWPRTSDLGSVQYQATVKIRDTLSHLASEPVATLCTYEEALELVDWALDQTFAPKREAVNIQILGMLETTGLNFDHLWVCGMSAEQFPGKSTLSAFIPRLVAFEHGIPRSTQTQELEFAERTFKSWCDHSENLHLSFTHTANGARLDPSPLASGLWDNAASNVTQKLFDLSHRHPFMIAQGVELSRHVDSCGTPLDEGSVSGGTSRLENHAECAFKSYALNRLSLSDAVPARDFLNAMERGSALHWVMEQLFRRFPDSADATTQPAELIHELCASALTRYSHLPATFVTAEQQRLAQLVLQWIALEANRAAFRVMQTEQKYSLSLGGFTFELRIDRLDEVDGAIVLIDYKTGKVSAGAALSETLNDPQLPAYSLIRDDIAGVYYAQVRHEDSKLVGLAHQGEQLTDGKKPSIKTTVTDLGWTAQRALWREQLLAAVEEIGAGDARVNPKPGACRYCHLQALCRVEEKRLALTLDG